MRITPELLHKIARDTVNQRTRNNRDIIAVYLIGSLLSEEPLLGGTADIDLVFIHNEEIDRQREIIRLTEEVHLDIAHHPRHEYHQTRELRLHPWMGPNIYGCKILHDPQHFMDFTMASVSGQFFQPENIMARSRTLSENARQIWLSYQLESPQGQPADIASFLEAVENAANSLAVLHGPPLPERRMLLQFPARAAEAGRPGLYKGLLGLLGAHNVDVEAVRSWLPVWRTCLAELPHDSSPPTLHPHRLPYYLKACETILARQDPMACLWPLLKTWNLAISLHKPESAHQKGWEGAIGKLGFLGDGFQDRLNALDAFLDNVEEIAETWASDYGIEQSIL
jgi:hypothetical protein